MTSPGSLRHARRGLRLFVFYLILYGAFVLVNAFAPQVMEATPLAGVNLAILSGFALILVALALAVYYGWFCRASADDSRPGDAS